MTRLLSLIIICLASTMVPGQGLPEAYFCGKGDHGNKWQLVGPNPAPDMLQAVGLLRSVAVDPVDPNILYVGTEHSGLWKTLDGGDHWENISDTLKVPSLGFTELSINPDNPAEIVAGTRTRSFSYPHWQDMSKGYGLLFSADQGRSWSKAVMREAEEPFQYIEILKRDPHDPDHLLAAGNRKVWQSHDGGREWELVFENPTELPAWFIDLEFSLDDPKVILASTKLHGYGGAKDQGGLRKVPHAAQAFSSVNGGEKGSWREVTPPHTQKAADFAIHIVMDVTPADPGFVYAVHALNRTHMIHKTRDGGLHWQMVDSVPNSGLVAANWSYFRHELELSDHDPSVIYAGTNTLVRSEDGGRSWRSLTQYIPHGNPQNSTHGDIRGILNLGYDSQGDELLIVNDGGVAFSGDGGSSWKNLNGSGLAITEFYAVDVFRSLEKECMVAGALHNGTFLFRDSTWFPFVVGGDGDWSEIDHFSDPERVYTMNNGRLWMSDDLGQHYRAVPGQPENRWIQGQRFEVNPHDHNQLLYGLYELYSFNASTNTWKKLFSKEPEDHTGSEVAVAKISPSDPDLIYLAFDGITWGQEKDDHKFYKSEDGGKSWTNLTRLFRGSAGIMYHWAAISDLVFDPVNPQRVFVSLKNYERVKENQPVLDRVMFTEDGGRNWQDMSAGLPPVPVNYLHYMQGSDDLIWAATDAGVYHWSSAEKEWKCFNHGFPNAIVTKLEVDPCSGIMYASTWGRGIWKVRLPDFHPHRQIKEDQTWRTERFYNGELRISQGATLTIMDTLYMGEKGLINIEKGGKLIIDGGVITVKNCGHYWQGVFRAENGKPADERLKVMNGGQLLKVRP